MKVIACLGNPEKRYTRTRHNIGFIIGEYLADKFNIQLNQKGLSSVYGTGHLNNNSILILLPLTYMNNSGQALRKALDYYKETIDNVIVIHDEIELAFGEIRLKHGGGHKGHNGLRSIIQNCGSPDFIRLRFGVGRPENDRISVADYVLSRFTKEEYQDIENYLPLVEELIISAFND